VKIYKCYGDKLDTLWISVPNRKTAIEWAYEHWEEGDQDAESGIIVETTHDFEDQFGKNKEWMLIDGDDPDLTVKRPTPPGVKFNRVARCVLVKGGEMTVFANDEVRMRKIINALLIEVREWEIGWTGDEWDRWEETGTDQQMDEAVAGLQEGLGLYDTKTGWRMVMPDAEGSGL
jgi:hypothetical protein